MDVRFIGHAAFTIRHGGVEVLCDPWFRGRVFHEGWDHFTPTNISIEDLPDVTHIWFSHEHPDHFHVPTLRSIPPERRQAMTVLFQDTIDRRVAEFCRELGFGEVRELRPEWVALGSGLDIRCEAHHEGNSWIAFRADGRTILNLNDCGVRHEADGRQLAGRVGPVDVLMTQFSYAVWVGNPDERERRERAAREKLDMVRLQCEVLGPAAVIPIASYVYFCHRENFFLNDAINTASATRHYLLQAVDAEPVVLYPGDVLVPGATHDSGEACSRYDLDLERAIESGPQEVPTAAMSLDDLRTAAEGFAARLRASAPWYLRVLLRPASVHLWDLETTVELTASGAVRPSAVPASHADVAIHSESLALCLRQPWGIDTLGVSGRMHQPRGGRYRRFYKLFRPALVAMRGRPVDLSYIVGSLVNQALVRAGRRSN